MTARGNARRFFCSRRRESVRILKGKNFVMKKVLIPTKLDAVASKMLAAQGYEVFQSAETPLAELAAAHPDAAVVIVRSEKVTPEIIDALPKLRLVVRAGAGYDNIDIVYARKKNIDVMNTPGANANGVAEEVVAMTLACFRHVVPADISVRAGRWEKKNFMGRELTKKTVGIVGLGNIGRLLAKRLQGFEPTLLGYDHFLAKQRAVNIGVRPVPLEQLFEESDVISLHVPGGPSTRNMVSTDLLSRMKDGALLVNCSRYGVVDEEALAALKAKLDITALGDLTPEKFEANKELITDPVQLKRAKHAVYENQRTIDAVAALKDGDIEKFGQLMNQSHVSLRDDYEVSCEEIDILVDLAWKIPGVIGSRITGGGFGGCTVSIVKNDSVDQFINEIGRIYKEKVGHEAEFYTVDIGDGAARID